MNLFRSEEHVTRWLDGRQPGATIPVTKLSELAHAWWGDRLSVDWRPHTRDQNQGILDGLGLVDEFWRLPGLNTLSRPGGSGDDGSGGALFERRVPQS